MALREQAHSRVRLECILKEEDPMAQTGKWGWVAGVSLMVLQRTNPFLPQVSVTCGLHCQCCANEAATAPF